MSDREVRAGIQQAKVGEAGFSALGFEALFIGAIAGVRSQSWGIGIAAFLGVLSLLMGAAVAPKSISNAVAFIIGAAWAVAASYLAGEAQPETAIMVAFLAGLIGVGAHVAGFQYIRDTQRPKG